MSKQDAPRWRVKILSLDFRIEPMFRCRTIWLKERVGIREERPCHKGGWQYVLLMPLHRTSFPFRQMLGVVVSEDSQLPLVQHVGFGGMGAALLRSSWAPDLQLQGAVRGDWLAGTGCKGLAPLPQSGLEGWCNWCSRMQLVSSWDHILAWLPFPALLSFLLSLFPKSTSLINHFH